MSPIIVPPPATRDYGFTDPPDWDRFRGNNHEEIPRGVYSMGGVWFAGHIGKPLTPELWKDLLFRLRIRRLRVYGPNDEQWTDAMGGDAAVVYLDDAGNVRDIGYHR